MGGKEGGEKKTTSWVAAVLSSTTKLSFPIHDRMPSPLTDSIGPSPWLNSPVKLAINFITSASNWNHNTIYLLGSDSESQWISKY